MTDSNESIKNQLKDEDSEASRLLKDILRESRYRVLGDDMRVFSSGRVANKFTSSKAFMRKAIEIDPNSLMYASDELKKDPELLLAAEEESLLIEIWICKDEENHLLKSCSKKFISSKAFMRKAIKMDPNSLMYASDELKKDQKLQLAAEEERLLVELSQYRYLSHRMHNDEGHPLKNCPKKFISNKSFMRKAIQIDTDNLMYASDKLKKDQDLLLAAVKENPFYYQEIPDELIKDKKLFYNTAKDHMLKLLESDEDFPNFTHFYSDYWIKDGDYKISFVAFSNDMDFASEVFNSIEDWPNRYIDFFDFLGPILLENNEYMESFYHRMAKRIDRDYSDLMGCLDIIWGDYDLSDEEINNHLSGIRKYLKGSELKKKIEELTDEERKLFEKTLNNLPNKSFKNLYGENWKLEKRATALKIIKKQLI